MREKGEWIEDCVTATAHRARQTKMWTDRLMNKCAHRWPLGVNTDVGRLQYEEQ